MLTKKQRYQKKYWAKPKVKEKKKLEQRVTYDSEKGQAYEKKRRLTPKSRWMRSKCNARKRNKTWTIELELFTKLIEMPCYYCKNSVENETGSSLDRKDNDLGYLPDNVVTCCKKCNRIRSKSMSSEEFARQTELNDRKKQT